MLLLLLHAVVAAASVRVLAEKMVPESQCWCVPTAAAFTAFTRGQKRYFALRKDSTNPEF
jgi:hypothetical protein